jgi:preprotein translocase subunit SecD
MLSPLLFSLVAPQQGCRLPDYNEQRRERPVQAAGEGLWIGGVRFEGADLISIEPALDESLRDQWALRIRFTRTGDRKFRSAQRCGVGRVMEVSFDRKVIARPTLYEPLTGGVMHLTAGWTTQKEAEAFAARIRSAR